MGPGVEVKVSDETGRVSFIGVDRARALALPTPLSGSSPATIAREFLERHAGSLGLSGRSELVRSRTGPAPRGGTAVRLQQEYRRVPVLGGEFIVNLTAAGEVLSVIGEADPVTSLDVVPAVEATAAIDAALALTARDRATSVSRLRPTQPELWVYDSRLLGGPGLERPLLVWRLEVRSLDDPSIRELVLVDAERGYVALHFDQAPSALARSVCDAANTGGQVPCTAPVRSEGQGPTGNADVDNVFDYSGDTYAFFSARFGRDSLDGAGLPLRATVRYCELGQPCPYENAFWNGDQIVIGQGFGSDDVVGHELTHGLTQSTSNLFPYYQSGAIGESISDVFAELIDLTNGRGNDAAAVRWKVGEDLPVGVIRDMRDPPAIGDPDRMTSPLYVADPDQDDEGGIHGNSGVNNKAAFLITDGGSFNGQQVSGLGLEKVARLYYVVETTMLTSASDYADLGNALRQACANLVGIAGISVADCAQVGRAVAATEMGVDPPRAPAPEAPVCAAGESAADVFFDNMETVGAWTTTTAAPWGYVTGYATSGVQSLYTPDRSVVSDAQAISPPIALPAAVPAGGIHLRFAHAYGFDDDPGDGGGTYDGGVLEYSTDGGATWVDAGPLFSANGYNGAVATGFGNPLAARSALVRESHGYVSSRLNLGSLLGQTVRFRLREGTDDSFGDFGWIVDDFRVYTCADVTPPETAITSGPAKGSVVTSDAVSFAFSSSESGSSFECSLDGAAFRACVSPLRRGLGNGRHRFSVRATDAARNVDPTPASVSFLVSRTGPQTRITAAEVDPASGMASFSFSSSGGLAPIRFQCKLDGRAYGRCRSPRSYRNLDPGRHAFRVRAKDRLGRLDPTAALKRFTVPG